MTEEKKKKKKKKKEPIKRRLLPRAQGLWRIRLARVEQIRELGSFMKADAKDMLEYIAEDYNKHLLEDLARDDGVERQEIDAENLVLGRDWICDSAFNPIDACIYDDESDGAHYFCIFCQRPEESL